MDPKELLADSMTIISHLDFNEVINRQLRAQQLNSSRASVSKLQDSSYQETYRRNPGRSESQTLTNESKRQDALRAYDRSGTSDSIDGKSSVIERQLGIEKRAIELPSMLEATSPEARQAYEATALTPQLKGERTDQIAGITVLDRARQSTLPSLKKSIEGIQPDKAAAKKLTEFDKYKLSIITQKDARGLARVGRSDNAGGLPRDDTLESDGAREAPRDPYRKLKEPSKPSAASTLNVKIKKKKARKTDLDVKYVHLPVPVMQQHVTIINNDNSVHNVTQIYMPQN